MWEEETTLHPNISVTLQNWDYEGRPNINGPLSVATSEWARLGNDLVRQCGGDWGPSSPLRQTLPSPQLVEFKTSESEVPITIAQRVVIKFLTNENIGPNEIWHRLHTLPNAQVSSCAGEAVPVTRNLREHWASFRLETALVPVAWTSGHQLHWFDARLPPHLRSMISGLPVPQFEPAMITLLKVFSKITQQTSISVCGASLPDICHTSACRLVYQCLHL